MTTGFVGQIATVEDWWPQWKQFMFARPMAEPPVGGYAAIKPHAEKYRGALSEQEIALSQPLQARERSDARRCAGVRSPCGRENCGLEAEESFSVRRRRSKAALFRP